MEAKPKNDHPAQVNWVFDPSIPTYDFFHGQDPSDSWGLQECVDNFIFKMERRQFLTWEAVVSHEQGLPLTELQEEILSDLVDFTDPDDDQVLYIDDIPRTTKPWYDILNTIVPHLLIEPFRTSDMQSEVKCEGWGWLTDCLRQHGRGLSLPEGVASPMEVVPLELRHKLRLQACLYDLAGLGQEEDISLEEQPDRIERFLDNLRKHRDTVEYFDLTLDSLLTRVILPEKDRPLFVTMMQEQLALASTTDRISESPLWEQRPVGRISEEQVKQSILHPDLDARNAAVYYFARSFSQDKTIMPFVIRAIEKYGWKDAFDHWSFMDDLVQTEETALWIIDELKRVGQPDNEEEASYFDGLSSALATVAPTFLEEHHSQLMSMEELDDELRDAIDETIFFLSFGADKLWEEVTDFCEHEKGRDYLTNDQAGFATRLVIALARHPEQCADRVLELLTEKVEDCEDNPMRWMEILAASLAGEMRLEAAIELLIGKLHRDDDTLYEECIFALTKIGTDAVVEAMADKYMAGESVFRISAASILGEIHSDLSVETCLRLAEHEDDIGLRASLYQAVLVNCSPNGIEPARQLILNSTLNPDIIELRKDLLTACDLMDATFPELEKWKEESENDVELRKQWYASSREQSYEDEDDEPDYFHDEDHEEPVPPPQTIVRDEKVGRNAACPCSSGKKYKKCCLKKPDGASLFD